MEDSSEMRFNNDPTTLRRLVNVKARLATFDSWNVPFIKKESLAQNGFYYRGPPDRCVCIFCGIEVGDWEEGDDPEVEHRKFNPNCKLFDFATDSSTIETRSIRSEDECGCVISSRPPTYSTAEARLKTFTHWPISMKQIPKKMAQAGFYYTGIGDKVFCYSCGSGIHKWEESDDPWFEHAKWSPKCEHILREKGQDFVDYVQREFVKQTEESLKNECIVRGTGSKGYNPLLCAVCHSEERNIVSMPCRHLAMCKTCNDKLLECPICRTQEKESIEVLIP